MDILPAGPFCNPWLGKISAEGRTTGDVPYKRDFSYSAVGTHTTKSTPGMMKCYHHYQGNLQEWKHTSVLNREKAAIA
jgi:hypothetical protein